MSCAAQMSSTSARRLSAVRASTWLKGSSMKSSSGSSENARAMPTRCFMPPDSSRGIGLLEAGQPDHADGARGALARPRPRRGPAVEHRLDVLGDRHPRKSAKLWKTMADPRVQAVERPAVVQHLAARSGE